MPNPLAGYIATGAAVIIAVLSAGLYFLFSANEEKAATIGTLKGDIAGLEATIKAHREQAELSKNHADEIAGLEAANDVRTQNLIAEINHWRLTAEKEAREKPFDFGNDTDRRLSRVMCRIGQGNNSEGRTACNLATTDTDAASTAFAITVTAETVEYWNEQCEAGNRDFCDWSITGFTPQGLGTLFTWLEMVDRYQLDQANWIEGARRLIDKITETEEKGGD